MIKNITIKDVASFDSTGVALPPTPRTADAQADYFKNNGEYSEVKNGDVKTVLNSAKVGDHIFFKFNISIYAKI